MKNDIQQLREAFALAFLSRAAAPVRVNGEWLMRVRK